MSVHSPHPPVAVPEEVVEAERRKWTPAKIAIWVGIALLGGVSWTMIALVRGETINAIWFVFAAVATYFIGYRFYSVVIERYIPKPDDRRATPAEYKENAQDFMPTDRRVLYGHHFAAIAGAGPLVGPVLAAQWGYLPGTIWIIVGVVVASLIGPMLGGSWLLGLPWGVDVVLFTLIGMPTYVCASGATPLVAVLLLQGVSPGAALAFLLAGPATNVTTFGVLNKLHGRTAAIIFAATIAALAIGLGMIVNLVVGDIDGLSLPDLHHDAPSLFAMISLALLALLYILSILRQGPRGFMAQVHSPFEDESAHAHHHHHHHHHHHDGEDHHGHFH